MFTGPVHDRSPLRILQFSPIHSRRNVQFNNTLVLRRLKRNRLSQFTLLVLNQDKLAMIAHCYGLIPIATDHLDALDIHAVIGVATGPQSNMMTDKLSELGFQA